MWANAQHDGRPAEHRWRPLFNAAKFGWRPILDRSQPLVGRSSPYCGNMWRRYCCLKVFFRLSIRALIAKTRDKVVRWCPDGDFLTTFCVLYLQRAPCSTFQTCILNSHEGHTMCVSMVDIQSTTAEIRRGKKKIEEEEETTGQKYNGLPWRP